MELATQQTKPQSKTEAPKPKVSILSRATSGKLQRPYRVVIYGPEKVGKSTFANDTPDPIFLDVEKGTEMIDVKNRVPVETWKEYLQVLQEVRETAAKGTTLVVDSMTKVEELLIRRICEKEKKNSLADFSHGRGHVQLYAEFDRAMLALDEVIAAGISVVLIAHSKVETFRNPEGDDFNRYEIALNRNLSGTLKKWANATLFARFEVLAHKEGKNEPARGVGGRRRLIETVGCDAFEAGNRYSLPQQIELSWRAFDLAAQAGLRREQEIVAEIRQAMAFISEEKQELTEASIKSCAGDVAKLMQTLNWVHTQQQKQ